MAERPDLEYWVSVLDRELRGRTVVSVRVRKPVVLRLAVDGEPGILLRGRRFGRVTRRGHFVRFALDPPEAEPLEIIVSPMLAGRFALDDAEAKAPGDLAMAWALDDGRELRYRDDVQMGKVYVIPAGRDEIVPGLATVGVDALDKKAFTTAKLRALAKGRRDQVRVFLMDKSALDSFGNAYADETLFEARIHPKTWVRDLKPADIDRLHAAIVRVLREARDTVAARRPPLDVKLRDFLKVRNRHGEPCPRCGDKLRKAGVRGEDSFFCPRCQPETRKSGIVDWRDLG